MTAVPTTERPGSRAVKEAAGNARSTPRGGIRGWLGGRALTVVAAVLRRLPVGLVQRGGHLLGGLLYRAQPLRARAVRDNLDRVCRYLAANGMGGDRVTAAARDERALDALVREAFGHYVRGYLESATLPAYASEKRLARVVADDAQLADEAFTANSGAMILIAMHFGAIEIPALWASSHGQRITAPMETIDDVHLQRYFQESRSRTGLNVIPLSGAATTLRRELDAGRAVALVADRPIGGSGIAVELFGAATRLPAGPAVLAIETGFPAWVVSTRRVGYGDYRARIERIELPVAGSRRERVNAFMAAQARAFERAVADAPEQWWTTFFPIWKHAGDRRSAASTARGDGLARSDAAGDREGER